MISDDVIRQQLPFVLKECDFPELGECYHGKVRDNYLCGDTRIIITSDRLSCFDVVVAHIPFKGEILNRLALYWFAATEGICPNHLIDIPDPNVVIVQNCNVLPIEVVMRRYLAGSAWRSYKDGQPISGIKLPPGLKEYDRLPELLITPSTKAEIGKHDEAISEEALLASGLVERILWAEIRERAFNLFRFGEKMAAEHGLLLVDTKYEFGLTKDGNLILVDEIHTLDSSRYWVAGGCQERIAQGLGPEMLDKEPARQWLLSQGYSGDGTPPVFSDDKKVELSKHYVSSYERISGLRFAGVPGDPRERIRKSLERFF